MWLENLDALKINARKLELDFRAAEKERDEARAALDALYAEGERFGEAMRQKDMEAERVRAEAGELDAQTKDQSAAIAVLESGIAHNQENIDRAQAELVESDSRAGGLAAQAAGEKERAQELSVRLEKLNEGLDALLERARAAAAEAGGQQSEAEALRGREAVAVAAAAGARAEAAAVSAEADRWRSGAAPWRQRRLPSRSGWSRPERKRRRIAALWRTQGMKRWRRPISSRDTACGWRSGSEKPPPLRKSG